MAGMAAGDVQEFGTAFGAATRSRPRARGGAEGGVLDGEGHLTLFVNRVGEIQEWLLARLRT